MSSAITKNDVRFLILIIGLVVPLTIWGITLQAQVKSNESDIKSIITQSQISNQSLSSIDRRLLKIEVKLGIDQISLEEIIAGQ